MNQNYSNERTENVVPFVSFTKDFINPGDFAERTLDDDIFLMHSFQAGTFISGAWHDNLSSSTYDVILCYKNKNNVEVALYATRNDPVAIESYNFVKSIAKNFFLVNIQIMETSEDLDDDVNDKVSNNTPLDWDDIESGINALQTVEFIQFTTGNSWRKTMTCAEAQELIRELKLPEVKFPTYEAVKFTEIKRLTIELPCDMPISHIIRDFMMKNKKHFSYIADDISGNMVKTFQGMIAGSKYEIVFFKNIESASYEDAAIYIKEKGGIKPGLRGAFITWENFGKELETGENVFLTKGTEVVPLIYRHTEKSGKHDEMYTVKKSREICPGSTFVYFKEVES